ncbi:MAG: toll/interleukin-1 receptor domain-containing protein [Chloroflexi bacterium]|nr:toll/interleukin-1 receptor domain-containing protein [Chloroflexota bacterium]
MPSVFISYSHKDEEWKDRVVTHLRVLEMEGMLDVWDDRRIEGGDDWKPEIEKAINNASIAILMISANFLTSKFILGEEAPKLLKRRAKEGLRVIPLIVKPCAWQQVKWLSPIQARPLDGKPLSTKRGHNLDSSIVALAEEVAKFVKRMETPAKTSEVSETSEVWRIPPDKISLAKLPSTSPDLFGREDRLKELDAAWDSGASVIASEAKQSPSGEGIASTEERRLATLASGASAGVTKINIFSLVAWGGVGKSALVNKWLTQMGRDNFRGAKRVYGWSFYSQGAAEGRQVSADQFIAAALTWFGDPDPTAGSPWDKGERLAELVKQSRTLLILDGLEPLQNPPPVETGRIKDPALVSFLREVARQNPGLVVISTRLAVDDLKDFKDGSAKETDLESLSDESGAAYLKHLGVDGTDAERQQASHDFGGHALALTLLGRYLKVVHNGDIRKRGEIPHVMDEQKQGAHARRVMESYERWLQGKPELDILRLMGLFDRPAEKGALDALRKEPAIPGLTDSLQKLSEANWKYAVNNLRELRLLAPEDLYVPDELDCHPLLREHFGEKLNAENAKAWQEAHGRLYEYYKFTAKELPDTLEEMAPLFAAVMHGCQARLYKRSFVDYYTRILRGGDISYCCSQLGAIGADLASLFNFFEIPWSRPAATLTDDMKGVLLSSAGFRLRSLARLEEAAQAIQSALEITMVRQDWGNAVRDAINLSGLYMTLGDVNEAVGYAMLSIEIAKRSNDSRTQMLSNIRFAHCLHQLGNFDESKAIFHQAEYTQTVTEPEYTLLYGKQGFEYCELLLDLGKPEEVLKRSKSMFEWRVPTDTLVEVALDNLAFGKALFQLRLLEQRLAPIENPATYFEFALDGLRESGQQDELPLGLLARAEYYRLTGDLVKAQKDVDEAFTIATRGGMGLHLADCHLEYARLNVKRSIRTPHRGLSR